MKLIVWEVFIYLLSLRKTEMLAIKNLKESFVKVYDKEAMKVIDLMTTWKPGLLKGIPVRTKITLPIRYLYE